MHVTRIVTLVCLFMATFLSKELLLCASLNTRFLASNDPTNIFEALKYAFCLRHSAKKFEKAIYLHLRNQYNFHDSQIKIALQAFLQTTSSDIDICIEDRLMKIFLTYRSFLMLIILFVKCMYFVYSKK